MKFCIQASCPHELSIYDPEDETLDEAIETVYPLQTESAFIVWEHVFIPLSYKYDISVMLSDILKILEALMTSSEGEHIVHWPTNTFAAVWRMHWKNEHMTIHAEWRELVGGLETLLNSHNKPLTLNKHNFLCEWKQILCNVMNALTGAGYTEQNLPEMMRLISVYENIQGEGALYHTPV